MVDHWSTSLNSYTYHATFSHRNMNGVSCNLQELGLLVDGLGGQRGRGRNRQEMSKAESEGVLVGCGYGGTKPPDIGSLKCRMLRSTVEYALFPSPIKLSCGYGFMPSGFRSLKYVGVLGRRLSSPNELKDSLNIILNTCSCTFTVQLSEELG